MGKVYRIIALLSAVFALMPAVGVEAEDMSKEWACGGEVSCVLRDDGEFVVSGNGAMYDYIGAVTIPWSKDTKLIKRLTVEKGVTSIGYRAFQNCSNLKLVDLSLTEGSLNSIGGYAFNRASSLSFVYIPGSVTAVGDYAFDGADHSLKIYVAGSENFVSKNWNNRWNKTGTRFYTTVYGAVAGDFYGELIGEKVSEIKNSYLSGNEYLLYSTNSLKRLETVLNGIENRSPCSREEYEEAFNSMNEAVLGLRKWTRAVVTRSEPEGAGLLSGGGLYADEEEICLASKSCAGFRFMGWYEDGVFLNDGPEFVYVPDGSLSSKIELTACFETMVTRGLSLDVDGGSIQYTINDDIGVWNESLIDRPFPLGQKIALRALEKDNARFMYWVDLETKRILSRSEEFSFRMRDEMKIRACYKSEGNEHYVSISDLGGKVLYRGLVDDGSGLLVKDHGNYAGYIFRGWQVNDNERLLSSAELKNMGVYSDLKIESIYEKKMGFVVEVAGGVIADGEESASAGYCSYGDRVRVVADEMGGEGNFAGWYVDDVCVSGNREYSFYVTGNIRLEARFFDEEGSGDGGQRKEVAFISIGADREVLEDGREMVHSVVRWSVMEGFGVIDGGLIRSFDKDRELTLENVDGVDVKVARSVSGALNTTYDHSLILGEVSRHRNVYLRGFVRLVGEDTGEVLVMYSDVAVSEDLDNDWE